jgi:2-polyprenyl-3-methyl-5-hydroxy-6-metoxy-1,4-benzoquinol methylase
MPPPNLFARAEAASAAPALDPAAPSANPETVLESPPPPSADSDNWEFQNRRTLLYALVGFDFGPEPETRLDDIRKYKANESKFILDTLALTPTDRVLDLGSGFGFVSRNVAPRCERVFCADISREFLACCREELGEFPNVEFHLVRYGDLGPLKNQRINKAYATAVFIHFHFYDIVIYLRELFDVLVEGGRFVFGMSDTDTLNLNGDKYFPGQVERYKKHRGETTLMHWNSAAGVCRAAQAIGFKTHIAYQGEGTAMIVLDKPSQVPLSHGAAPPHELTKVFCQWRNSAASLVQQTQTFCSRFPQDRDARFLLAESLRGAGMDDLAATEYEKLLEDCPMNERLRAEQGLAQCRADRSYFPPSFAQRLSTAEYAAGHNAEIWRAYAWREIQRSREIVRMIRQVTPLRGKHVLDVGSGYGGMLISMAEQGAAITGIEIDPERARMGKQRLGELGLDVPYLEGDICESGIEAKLGQFDVVVCQDVLEHVLDPSSVIRSLCAMMKPGGVIYIQIPNKYGLDQLMSDHHYALTGITALSRHQAIEYWQLATGAAAEHYGVGYERGEKFYFSAFARNGVKLNPVDRYTHVDHLVWYAPAVSAMCTRLESPIYPGLRPELEKRIRRRMTKVAQLYAHASEKIISFGDSPDLVSEACDAVVRRLCVGLWRFIGVKTNGNGAA